MASVTARALAATFEIQKKHVLLFSTKIDRCIMTRKFGIKLVLLPQVFCFVLLVLQLATSLWW